VARDPAIIYVSEHDVLQGQVQVLSSGDKNNCSTDSHDIPSRPGDWKDASGRLSWSVQTHTLPACQCRGVSDIDDFKRDKLAIDYTLRVIERGTEAAWRA
jgi:hypothetical protein